MNGSRWQVYALAAFFSGRAGFPIAEKRLATAFSTVENHVLSSIRRSRQQRWAAAGTFICHQFYPKCIRQINRKKASVKRYWLNIHTDVRYLYTSAFYQCDVWGKFAAIHQDLNVGQTIPVTATVKHPVNFNGNCIRTSIRHWMKFTHRNASHEKHRNSFTLFLYSLFSGRRFCDSFFIFLLLRTSHERSSYKNLYGKQHQFVLH